MARSRTWLNTFAQAASQVQLSFLQRTTDSLDGNSLIRCEEAHEARKGSPAYAQAQYKDANYCPSLMRGNSL